MPRRFGCDCLIRQVEQIRKARRHQHIKAHVACMHLFQRKKNLSAYQKEQWQEDGKVRQKKEQKWPYLSVRFLWIVILFDRSGILLDNDDSDNDNHSLLWRQLEGKQGATVLISFSRGQLIKCLASQLQYWCEMYSKLTLELIQSLQPATRPPDWTCSLCSAQMQSTFPPVSTVTAKMDLLSPVIQPKPKEHKVINTNFILRLRLLGVMTFRLNGTRWRKKKKSKCLAVNVSQSNSTHMKKLRKKSVDIIPLMMSEHLQRKYI